ncbi:hypothetical protein [Escherichia coli]|uniref:hypothetical protein n=1 Tax=Escherichia coli TaxID=562 RepID=UPI0012FDED4E|nr:hypothetical protein [Escherichia coli]MVW26337.1 hypothetical protein [Escherichia coli]
MAESTVKENPLPEIPRLRIYAMSFGNNKLALSTENRADFWLDMSIGWVKFEKLYDEDEFSDTGALFVATELRPATCEAPSPVVQAKGVWWRQREALLSAANTCSFLLGQTRGFRRKS